MPLPACLRYAFPHCRGDLQRFNESRRPRPLGARGGIPRLGLVLLGALLLAPWMGAANAAPSVSTAKPWTRWWWPGSAVDEQNITRELEAFAAAGLGGVEITPIYGAKGAETRYVPFLSERWMALLEHTGREAQRLGLGVDMATGTGWPFGGTWVPPEDGILKLVHADGRLAGAPTGMKVKRAAPGAEGLVVDPLSPAALDRYLAPFSKVFATFPRELVRAQFHDSFEYYESGWTAALPEKFREMHGYDIQDHAALLVPVGPSAEAVPNPAHTTGSGQARPAAAQDPAAGDDRLRRVKSDYRATLGQLHLEYLRAWVAWSRERGWLVRNQSHGAPANLLDLYGAVDIPETETFGSTPFPIPGLRRDRGDVRGGDTDIPDSLVIKMASSAAHVMGHPLASSETCTWLREHWKVALSFTKPEIDRLFVDGINHILYHGTVYSPDEAAWPGWLFYASTQFNPSNPWWDDFAALNSYVTRVQTALQEGRPDNDVLVYWPFYDVIDDPDGLMKQYGVHRVEWLREAPAGRMGQKLADAGFSFDFISDEQLQRSRAVDGAIATPGSRYRAIVVPATRRMPVATLARLKQLQQEGAAVIFESLPEDVPGLGRLEERRAQFRQARAGLTPAGDVVAALTQHGAVREGAVDAGLRFIRRETGLGYNYYFANLTARPIDQWVKLGRPVTRATLDDPTGIRGTGSAALRDSAVYLQLEPGASVLLLGATGAAPSPSGDKAWTYRQPAGAPTTLAGEWSVTFVEGGPDLPAAFATRELKSWTELGGEASQHFAGTARYRLEFELAANAQADDWLLDLGDVRESARVRVNGVEVATLWSLPFRVPVGAHLKPGRNVLDLDVTNLAANRIRDLDRRGVDWKIMREINFVNINYRPFNAASWEITASGLLGPVTLTPQRTIAPATSP